MPVFRLTDDVAFPPVHLAEPTGLLAVGGDLGVERLLLAYRSGIFPWYSDEQPILWWSPDPRFVLFPAKLRVSHSMRQVTNGGRFRATFNRDFAGVIGRCRKSKRRDQDGTWITCDMLDAYVRLHAAGHAHSVEVWEGEALVGGLYGVAVGGCFSGESMFTLAPNASKFALVELVRRAGELGIRLIDCQVRTRHLASLGAEEIPRAEYLRKLKDALGMRASWPVALLEGIAPRSAGETIRR